MTCNQTRLMHVFLKLFRITNTNKIVRICLWFKSHNLQLVSIVKDDLLELQTIYCRMKKKNSRQNTPASSDLVRVGPGRVNRHERQRL